MCCCAAPRDAACLPSDRVTGRPRELLVKRVKPPLILPIIRLQCEVELDRGVAELSPLLHMPERRVPLVVSYAPTETDELKRQSEIYMAAAVARGCPARFVAMPGTNHYDIVFGLANRESPLANAVLETMGLR